MWEEFFFDLLEILNFCQNVNTKSLIELAISRIQNATEALYQILPIIPREDRVVTEFLSNFLTSFQLLSQKCDLDMNHREWFSKIRFVQFFYSIPSIRFTNEPGRLFVAFIIVLRIS